MGDPTSARRPRRRLEARPRRHSRRAAPKSDRARLNWAISVAALGERSLAALIASRLPKEFSAMADPPGGEANSDQLFAAILRESTLDVHRMDEVVLSYQLSLRNPEDVNQSHIARIHDAIVASPSPVKSYLQMSLLEALYRLLTGHAHNVSVIVHSPPSGPLLLPDFVASEALNSC